MTDNVIRLAPSRNFLIRQAILNALNEHYSWGIGHYGAAEVLRRVEAAGLLGLFTGEVIHHFRLLTDIYDLLEEQAEDELGHAIGPGFASC